MIKQIKIRDFKSIRELDLELDPVTILIGRSGTGKSNIVQAIRFLRNLLINFDAAVLYEFGWERIVPAGERRPRTAVEVLFSIPGSQLDYFYRVGFRTDARQHWPGPIKLAEESLKLGDEFLFSRACSDAGQWEWKAVPKVSPPPPPNDHRLMLGQFPSLQQVVFANAALSTGVGYYHFPASTLSLISPSQHGQDLLKHLPGLSDNASNFLEVMRGITQDFHRPNIRKNLLASLHSVHPSIESIELDSLTNPQRAIIGHKAADRVFALTLDQESDGLRRFYAHLLALYQTPSKLALVFEEPENAIFPGALSILADEFKAAPREHRGQVILTTHSPTLLDAFDVESVRVVEMQDGCTRVARVANDQRQAVNDHLLTTGELLTVDRARSEDRQAVLQ